ncbi:hypothetical protein AWC38_SpisGene4955 [Stylophora pistillata]|uniref:Uncharacterized protein n=1 Tax=Stylophora pistillata TaxID=50429 RepID=A0A2B4SLI0_STYPI|nr:hypothetical protein AWC38_SpisGene4955 [Stylophora pistillata]
MGSSLFFFELETTILLGAEVFRTKDLKELLAALRYSVLIRPKMMGWDALLNQGVKKYHKHDGRKTEDKCLNNIKDFMCHMRRPPFVTMWNSIDFYDFSVTEIYRGRDDAKYPNEKHQVANFSSLRSELEWKINHQKLLHADYKQGQNGGVYRQCLEKADKFAANRSKEPPLRDKRIDCESRNAEDCDKDVRKTEAEEGKVRGAPSQSLIANNCHE